MQTFISYNSNIDRLAGDIKEYLDQYGFNCFLAHDDIPPQSRWLEKVEENLEESDLFLPLLTPEFGTSIYCQQETGYAYCRDIEILPVVISHQPMGFISGIQGIKFDENEFDESCWAIVKYVAKIKDLSAPILKRLIKDFGETSSYDEAYENTKNILLEFDFTPKQIRMIKEHIDSNDQIYHSKTARPYVLDFIEKYSDHFGEEFVEEYKERSSYWIRR